MPPIVMGAAGTGAMGSLDLMHSILLDPALGKLREADSIDGSRAVVDSFSVRAVFGGRKRARIRQIPRELGSQHPVLTDGQGLPLAVTWTSANRHDVTPWLPLVDAIPPLRWPRGADAPAAGAGAGRPGL